MRYLIIDTANMFFRARHAAFRAADAHEKVGYAMHVTLSSVNRMYRKFGADHVLFCLEGRSWRKDVYPRYKRNRSDARAALTEKEQEEEQVFWEVFEELTKYLKEQTNCSVIRHERAEADDIIARWVDLHPDDNHIIISSDTDFVQLLSDNVQQYNGVMGHLITTAGILDDKDRPVKEKKTGEPKVVPDPEWLLFEKCVRGDATDNVFSAYPGVRKKGTKNKTGLIEAFEDRKAKGFSWNNLMLQRWTDHEGVEHRVLDDYERNRKLIDLRAQPDDVKAAVDAAIAEQVSKEDVAQVGVRFMRFCGRHELIKLSEMATQLSEWLNKTYQGAIDDQSNPSNNR